MPVTSPHLQWREVKGELACESGHFGGEIGSCINEIFWKKDITLQLRGATSHTANRVQEWYNRNRVRFWLKDLWPHSSQNLNHLNLAIWSILESKAYSSNHSNVYVQKNRFDSGLEQKCSKESVRAPLSKALDSVRRVVKTTEKYIKTKHRFS